MIDLEKRYGRERKKVSWKELEGIMKEDGIVVEKGDMLFFYTGYGDVSWSLLCRVACSLDYSWRFVYSTRSPVSVQVVVEVSVLILIRGIG